MNYRQTIGACVLTLAGLGLAGGCVNQDTYDHTVETTNALKARNQDLLEQVKSLEAAQAALRESAQKWERSSTEQQKYLEDLRAQNASLSERIAQMDQRARTISIGPLDSATSSALSELAQQHPTILTFDPAKGMLRFTSDVTFASGSADLTSEAKTTIAALGKILIETPSAQQYDIRVVGHTDSQPMSSGTAGKFKNNLMLSAFRAASVHNDLVHSGIAGNKIEIAGWGEMRPAVANNPNGNTPQNRRVEVYLVRSSLSAADLPAPERPTAPARSTTPVKKDNIDIMK